MLLLHDYARLASILIGNIDARCVMERPGTKFFGEMATEIKWSNVFGLERIRGFWTDAGHQVEILNSKYLIILITILDTQ